MAATGLCAGRWLLGSWLNGLIVAEIALVSLFSGVMVAQILSGPALKQALAKRGQSDQQHLAVSLTEDVLTYDLDGFSVRASLSAVTDVYCTKRHWVFLIQTTYVVLRGGSSRRR